MPIDLSAAIPSPSGDPGETPSPATPGRPTPFLHIVLLLAVFLGIGGGAYAMMQQQFTQQAVTSADASACVAVISTGVLLQNSNQVPDSTVLANADVSMTSLVPVAVSVVRRTPDAIGIEFPPAVARAHPELVRFYASVPLAQLSRPSCPYAPAAHDQVNRLLDAMYH